MALPPPNRTNERTSMEVLTGPDDPAVTTRSAGLLLGALPIPAVVLGPDDAVVASNQAADGLLCLAPAAAGQRSLADAPETVRAVLASGLAELRGTPRFGSVRRVFLRRDGYPVTLMLTPIGAAGGSTAFVMVAAPSAPGSGAFLGEDSPATTGQVKDFLAMLAHELRNPLATILHALHIIRHRVQGDGLAVQAADVANRQARHQARLLDDLLDVSRVILGKISLHAVDTDLGAVLQQAVDASQLTFQARAHGIRVTGAGGPLPVHGDPDRLEQVIKNLLVNAAKYSSPGKDVWVSAERAHGMAVVRVRDEGVGIEPGVLLHVFDLFFQADSSLARPEGGLGVGLTLAHHIVQMHGGVLLARSAGRGRGSEFEMRLPLLTRRETPGPAAPPAGRAAPPHRVLVIEDNPDAREMLRVLLELKGHVVDAARDGRSGIKAAAAQAPDVVLIDIGLPDLSGYDVARALRQRLGSEVRLIALTGYGDPAARRLANEAGFDRHLVKPVAPEHLMRALDSP